MFEILQKDKENEKAVVDLTEIEDEVVVEEL